MSEDETAPRPGLRARILEAIRAGGPMSVADYMAACLFDPAEGYYATQQPFGAEGDFTTAPEIHQMFGEIVAAWLVHGWRAMGAPANAAVVEIGPGRGTLMLDMARTLERIAPDLTGRLHMVEASAGLTALQRERLGEAGIGATWHESIATLPDAPWLMVANELFDAVPARQYVARRGRWHERCVVAAPEGSEEGEGGSADGSGGEGLAFAIGAGTLAEPALDARGGALTDGTVREVAPAREALMASIADHLVRRDGIFLTFDYGHASAGALGDTLQAVRAHSPADPLADPGRADLTTHVDFAALAAAARGAGASVAGIMEQGAFLLACGLLERAGALGANASEAEREAIRAAVERLAGPGPEGMGELFKAMAVTGRARALPPFSASPLGADGR